MDADVPLDGTGESPAGCSIAASATVSAAMPTVGVVEWSTTLANPGSARVVYALSDASPSVRNRGGTAPVDVVQENNRTLLLGLKQASTYSYFIEATSADGTTCKSSERSLTTGALSGATIVTRLLANPSAQAGGFIVTSGGQRGRGAFILDADGAVVWYAAAPRECSRAHMDYEGANMWMLSLNSGNAGGEMRFLSMDGQVGKIGFVGLADAHHDFTVLPGKIAAMVWTARGQKDPESDLVEMAADGSGTATPLFRIGADLYLGSSGQPGAAYAYHCNYVIYHPEDDSFTISDRDPNLFVKVGRDGTPVWQIGGSCTDAKAPKCAPGTWKVNHGHDFTADGTMLIFNNAPSSVSHVLELGLVESTDAISYTTVKDFSNDLGSNVLGDVQRLPNGNTLMTYSTAGQIIEVDPGWNTVQILQGNFGYAEWRATLYGPPSKK